MGQCVIEKLLRCCPKIKKIYILLRKKRNMNAHERVAHLINLPVCTVCFFCFKHISFLLVCIIHVY